MVKTTYDDRKTWLDDTSLLSQLTRRLEGEHRARQTENKTALRRYWNRPINASQVDYSRPYRELGVYDQVRQVTGNLTREVVDAAISTVCRDMSCKVIPKGSDFKLDMACRQASRLIEGVFDNADFLNIATRVARDGMTADVGVVKGYVGPESNEIRFERVNPLEIMWVENGTDEPRTLLQISPVSRDIMAARYPAFKSEIMDASAWSPPTVIGVDPPSLMRSSQADTIKCIEAWTPALGDDKGKHAITLADGIVLFEEEWQHDVPPIARFVWCDDFRGYAGVSLGRIIEPYDMANRRLTRMVYAGLAGAVPWLLTHEDAEIDGVSDVEFQRVEWRGTAPPQVVMPQTVSPEVIAQIEKIRQLAFAEGGINQGLATGVLPQHYSSGVAQRQAIDVASTRLLQAQGQWERFWKRSSRIVVMLAEQARKTHVRLKGESRYVSVSMPSLSADKYHVSFGLASGLSMTPAGRLQDLSDLKDAGVIDTADMVRHLNLPDTEGLADRSNAARDLVEKQIGMALDEGKFSTPSALQGPDGLGALVRIGSQEFQRATMQGTYPKENLEVLRRLIIAAQARLAAVPMPQQPQPANDQQIAPPVQQLAA